MRGRRVSVARVGSGVRYRSYDASLNKSGHIGMRYRGEGGGLVLVRNGEKVVKYGSYNA